MTLEEAFIIFYSLDQYTHFAPDYSCIELDGYFDLDQLKAIAIVFEHKKGLKS